MRLLSDGYLFRPHPVILDVIRLKKPVLKWTVDDYATPDCVHRVNIVRDRDHLNVVSCWTFCSLFSPSRICFALPYVGSESPLCLHFIDCAFIYTGLLAFYRPVECRS